MFPAGDNATVRQSMLLRDTFGRPSPICCRCDPRSTGVAGESPIQQSLQEQAFHKIGLVDQLVEQMDGILKDPFPMWKVTFVREFGSQGDQMPLAPPIDGSGSGKPPKFFSSKIQQSLRRELTGTPHQASGNKASPGIMGSQVCHPGQSQRTGFSTLFRTDVEEPS